MHLNALTRLVCRFDGKTRSIEMLSGSATFKVTPDAAYPFDVAAGVAAVRVVGTHFEVAYVSSEDVGKKNQAVSVAVTEGIVEVRARTEVGRSTDAVRLTAGKRAVWRAGQGMPEVKAVSATAFAAWRSGRLQCEGEPLADVLVELSRYYPGKIELAQASLGDLRLSGTLPLDDWAQATQLLESVLPIRIRRGSHNVVLVEPASAALEHQPSR